MNSTFTKILRIVLGLGLIFFGLNKFIGFMAAQEMPAEALNFMTSLKASGYMLYVVAVFEIFIGFLLLSNKWVPFALLLLVPISANILLFHLFLDLQDIVQALAIVLLNVILIYKYWKSYRPLFH
jgi:putative oxidoreductase